MARASAAAATRRHPDGEAEQHERARAHRRRAPDGAARAAGVGVGPAALVTGLPRAFGRKRARIRGVVARLPASEDVARHAHAEVVAARVLVTLGRRGLGSGSRIRIGPRVGVGIRTGIGIWAGIGVRIRIRRRLPRVLVGRAAGRAVRRDVASGASDVPVAAADPGVGRERAAIGAWVPLAIVEARSEIDAGVLLEPVEPRVHHRVVAAPAAAVAVRRDAEHAPAPVVELHVDGSTGVSVAGVLAPAADERFVVLDVAEAHRDLALGTEAVLVVGLAEAHRDDVATALKHLGLAAREDGNDGNVRHRLAQLAERDVVSRRSVVLRVVHAELGLHVELAAVHVVAERDGPGPAAARHAVGREHDDLGMHEGARATAERDGGRPGATVNDVAAVDRLRPLVLGKGRIGGAGQGRQRERKKGPRGTSHRESPGRGGPRKQQKERFDPTAARPSPSRLSAPKDARWTVAQQFHPTASSTGGRRWNLPPTLFGAPRAITRGRRRGDASRALSGSRPRRAECAAADGRLRRMPKACVPRRRAPRRPPLEGFDTRTAPSPA